MDSRDIARYMRSDTFQPIALVTTNGKRHEIRRRELLKVMTNGVIPILHPATREDAHIDGHTKLNAADVASIEHLPYVPPATARSAAEKGRPMSPKEIFEALHPDSYEPRTFVTADGAHYEVRHPELARLVGARTLYIFYPSTQPDTHYDRVVKLACRNITAIVPLTTSADESKAS